MAWTWTAAAAVAAVLVACPRSGSSPADAGSARPAPAPVTRSFRVPSEAQVVPGLETGPALVFTAQLKATPDEKEADALAAALHKLGVEPRVHKADLGARGTWFRVGAGQWSRRDLAELEGGRIAARDDVRALVGATPPGEPAFIVQEIPRPERLTDAQVTALRTLAGDAGVPPVHVAPAGGKVRAHVVLRGGRAVAFAEDGSRAVDAVLAPPTCEGCEDLGDAVAEVSLVANVLGTAEPEWLVTRGALDRRVVTLATERGATLVELVSVLLARSNPQLAMDAEAVLLQLDGDADLELLVSGARTTFSDEKTACSADAVQVALDVERGTARRMDAALHGANGVARKQGGAQEIRAFLAGTAERAPELALDAALAYLAAAPDDSEVYGEVVGRAEAAGREGKRAVQLKALAGLVAVRSQWRVGLAPRLAEILPQVASMVRGGVHRGCTVPLLMGPAAQKARHDPREGLLAAQKRPDPARLSPGEIAALMMAFEAGSPTAQAVDDMVAALEVARPELVREARQVVVTRRNAPAAPVMQGAIPGTDAGNAAHVPAPAPRGEEP